MKPPDHSYGADRFEDFRKRLIFYHGKSLIDSGIFGIKYCPTPNNKYKWRLCLNNESNLVKRNEFFYCGDESSVSWAEFTNILESVWYEKLSDSKYHNMRKMLREVYKSHLFIFQLQANKKMYFTLCADAERTKMAASKNDEEVKCYGKVLYSSMDEDPLEVLWNVIRKGYFQSKIIVNTDDITQKGIEVAREGDASKVRDFLSEVRNVDWTDSNGWTMLHHAVRQGHLDLIKTLLTMKVDTELKDRIYGRKPIHIAAKQSNIVAIELLLDVGSSVDDADGSGWTPLHYAAWKGDYNTLKYLILKKANMNARELSLGKKPIHVAVSEGHTDIVQMFLDNGADIDDVDEEGRTLLYHSAFVGHFEMTKFLIDGNANVDYANKFGAQPIHASTFCDSVEVAELLINRGSDIESRTKLGCTPLHYAADREAIKLTQLLVERGASLSVKDNEGETPFDKAVDWQKILTASYLAEKMIKKFQDEMTYDESLKIYDNLFNMQKDKLGDDHSETLKTQTNMALMFSKMERYEIALDILKIILNKRQSVFHQFDASCTQFEMGRMYVAQWNLTEALHTFKEVYNIWQVSLGVCHLRTLSVARELASVHLKRHEYDVASKLYEDIFQKRKQSSGMNDPATWQAMQDVAIVLAHKGENGKALKLFKEVLSKRKDILGADHPDTRITGYHIVMVEQRLENVTVKGSCCLQ